ncbi:MAG: hypothetical protein IT378_19425, partial [Sandaracinaceae bacterium]|nr:hypothetical protein [Sandaracinaceae bacterium]
MRRVALFFAAAALGCGGSPAATRARSGHAAPDPAHAERRVQSAREAFAELAPERAARAAEDAIALGARGEAQEIAARARMLLGDPEAAARALEGASDPELLRLRARAQLALGRFAEADASLVAATRRGDEPDSWVESMRALCAAMGSVEAPYALEGAPEATLALVEAPLPIVRVRVDTTELLALVGTSAHFAVLDPSVRAHAGAISELGLGGLRVRGVPHTVRDLSSVRDAIGQDVRAVIGFDLLTRLHATLEGPGARLTVRAEPAALGETFAPFVTPLGAFVALIGRLGEVPAWISADTAGLFPIALTPEALETYGLSAAPWRPLGPAAGPAATALPVVQLGNVAIEEVPAVRGL